MDETGLTIASIAPPQMTTGGDFVYRLKQPYQALGKLPGVSTAAVTNIISSKETLLKTASLVVLHLIGDRDMIPLVEERRKSGLPTVFEISDNFLGFQKDNPAAAFYDRPESRATIFQLISMADAIQTSTPPLLEMFSKYNPVAKTFVNQMATTGSALRSGGDVIIGWGGSAGHFEDIKKIAPLISNLVAKKKNVKFSLMSDRRFADLFKGIPSKQFLWRMPGALAEYYNFVQTLDIGVACIADDEFNRCRSDVKFMEFASRGVAPVCSDAPTYSRTLRHGETGFLFKSPNELADILEMLIDDESLRRQVGSQALMYIENERTEDGAAPARMEFYNSLIEKSGSRGSLGMRELSKNRSLKKYPGANFFIHEMTDSEKYCYNGMIRLFGGSQLDEAAKDFNTALIIDPGHYLARHCYAAALAESDPAEAARACEKALAAHPLGFNAAVLALSLIAEPADRMSAAMELVEKFPYMAEAHSALAEALFNEGDEKGARESLEKAVGANPYCAQSATVLAMLMLENGELQEAEKILKHPAEINPGMYKIRLALASVYKALGKIKEAADEFLAAIDLRPDDKYAMSNLLELAKKEHGGGRSGEALIMLEKAFDAGAVDADARFWAMRIAKRLNSASVELHKSKLAIEDAARKYSSYYQDFS